MTSFATLVIATAITVGAALPAPSSELQPATADSTSTTPTVTQNLIIEEFPVLAVDARFRDDWRDRRSGGRRHEGTDIYADKGTPIVAVADGFVRSMHSGGKGGYMLWLTHADGWETWYMHLDNDHPGTDDGKAGAAAAYAPGLAVGDFVEAGQVVAFVGDSGNAETSEPHVHFELHRKGRKTNPHPELATAWDRDLMTVDVTGPIQ